jgi:hypothetical protein
MRTAGSRPALGHTEVAAGLSRRHGTPDAPTHVPVLLNLTAFDSLISITSIEIVTFVKLTVHLGRQRKKVPKML